MTTPWSLGLLQLLPRAILHQVCDHLDDVSDVNNLIKTCRWTHHVLSCELYHFMTSYDVVGAIKRNDVLAMRSFLLHGMDVEMPVLLTKCVPNPNPNVGGVLWRSEAVRPLFVAVFSRATQVVVMLLAAGARVDMFEVNPAAVANTTIGRLLGHHGVTVKEAPGGRPVPPGVNRLFVRYCRVRSAFVDIHEDPQLVPDSDDDDDEDTDDDDLFGGEYVDFGD
ncbi:hypothetical protein FN846DRAFT_1020489 [Sphaerosporella brunnea]|uniref:F-box domain-containing protein n=1 Tax=Sphaerosporella brunnea TaxID=1250544 RepID=A0A5J5F128_9PEZI|nr:hypothetical protein FN846DRAFT_1020489 [Sphaerosporella brunnea]